MKRNAILPTSENLKNSFIKDSIGRNKSIYEFVDILKDIQGNYSLALDSDWGNGKTFFVKQTQMIINALNPNRFRSDEYSDFDYKSIEENFYQQFQVESENRIINQIATYYDAWENDNDVDPILSIIYTIVSCLGLDDDQMQQGTDALKIASSIATLLSDKDIVKFKENIEKKDLLKEIREAKEIKKKVNDLIETLFAEHGDRIVIFIDELDRCRPNFAIELLERIKHYFTNDRITFVFSVNLNQLQYTVKKIYGNDFDGYRYLDRFFDLKISLPDINETDFLKYIDFEIKDNIEDNAVRAIIDICNFSLREQLKFISKVQIVQERYDSSQMFGDVISVTFIKYVVLPIMVALKIYDINDYYALKTGENPSMFIKLLTHPILTTDFSDGILSYLFKSNEPIYVDILEVPRKIDQTKIEEKAVQIYDAIFKSKERNQSVGNIKINNRIRNKINEVQSII